MDFTAIHIPGLKGIGAIVVSLIVCMIIGKLYYGPLFGKLWYEFIKESKDLKEKSIEDSLKLRWPYPMEYSYLSTQVGNLIKACFFWHW